MVLYIVPFLFVFEPVLLLEGPLWPLPGVLLSTGLALFLIAGGFEGYAPIVKRLTGVERSVFLAAGVVLLWPGLTSDAIGSAALLGVVGNRFLRRGRLASAAE